eukprot:GEZU01024790.1.p1 GENE.GEZU01024790.1~~GEZU01024790.1.p1  ORF type:complete len:118 (+),score=30.17 GEZU01024790.1:87-440(+)
MITSVHSAFHSQIMEFDQKRNVNRECLASLNKMKKAKGEDDRLSNQKSWLFVGSFFMKLPNSNIEQIIKKEQVNLDREIEALRKSVRNKTQKWEALERSLNRSLGKMDSMDEIDDDM